MRKTFYAYLNCKLHEVCTIAWTEEGERQGMKCTASSAWNGKGRKFYWLVIVSVLCHVSDEEIYWSGWVLRESFESLRGDFSGLKDWSCLKIVFEVRKMLKTLMLDSIILEIFFTFAMVSMFWRNFQSSLPLGWVINPLFE